MIFRDGENVRGEVRFYLFSQAQGNFQKEFYFKIMIFLEIAHISVKNYASILKNIVL